MEVVKALNLATHDDRLTIREFGLFVQTSSPANDINTTIDKIIQYRIGREKTKGKVKAYDRECFERVAAEKGEAYATIANDYPDVSFRYLKATGLFRSAGKGITLTPSRAELAHLLLNEPEVELENDQYLMSIWSGAKLPTDNQNTAYEIFSDLVSKLNERGESSGKSRASLTI